MQHLGRTFVWVWLFWLFLCQGQETTFTLCQGHHYSFRNESLHRERQLNTGCWSYNWRAKWAVNWLSWRGGGDKSRPWDNNVMQPIIYLFYNWSLKKHCYPFTNALLSPPPLPNTMSKIRRNCSWYWVFNIVCGVEGEARQTKLYSRMTVSRVELCTKSTSQPESASLKPSAILAIAFEALKFSLGKWYLHKQIHCFPAMFASRFKVWWVQNIISRDSVISDSFLSAHHPDYNIRHGVLRLLTKFKDV